MPAPASLSMERWRPFDRGAALEPWSWLSGPPRSTFWRRLLLLVLLLTGVAGAGPPTDSLQVTDVSALTRDPEAQERGFLTVSGGQFRWPDGTRARFWGVNVANRNLWIAPERIDEVVEAWSRAGVNLVRFEALDSRGGLLDTDGPGSRALNPERLRTLHYWISRTREKGMHYYLDLIDFRTFTIEDGVANAGALPRAARPYACFDPRLIELQKEYAGQLLTTVNPYTGLAPVEDPSLALVEVCNESGFFLNASTTDALVEPYRSELAERWNRWLLARYPERGKLTAAWGDALKAEEDPAAGSVALPHLTPPLDPAARGQDGVEFLAGVQRHYFRTMKAHLRGLGLKVPVTAVVSSDVPADLASVAAEMDFLAENHYVDHPAFAGEEWQGKFFYQNKNPLRDASRFGFAPFTATLRWEDRPVVVREWGCVWPNGFRATSVPEVVAYASLQDYDGLLLFSYKTGPRLEEFGYQADPTVWGMFALGGLAFLRQDLSVSDRVAELVYPVGPEAARVAYALRARSCRQPSGTSELLLTAGGTSADQLLTTLGLWDQATLSSSTGQIQRRTGQGLLRLEAPRLLGLAGELPREVKLGPLEYAGTSPVGGLLAVSLDGQPLVTSRHLVVKFVSVAENSGQSLVPAAGGPAPLVLDQAGSAPVLTLGTACPTPTRLKWKGRTLLSLYQQNGVFELLLDNGRGVFWTDTPGVRLRLGNAEFVSDGSIYDVPLRL